MGKPDYKALISAATDKAREILHDHKTFILGHEEWARFSASLEETHKPNEKLKQALAEYQTSGIKIR